MKRLLSLLFVLMTVAWVKAEQLQVDFSTNGGTIVYKGSGILHSIGASTPVDALVIPQKIRLLRAKITLAESVYTRIVTQGGGKIQIVLSDSWTNYSNSPTDAAELNTLADIVTTTANKAISSNHTAGYEWDIWNEPDNGFFWNGSIAQFYEAWRRAFVALRTVIPTAVVVGPSYWSYNSVRMSEFLDYCKANNVCPDVLSWHEINGGDPSGPHLIDDHKNDAVALLSAKSIGITRFSINEINSGTGSTTRYHPGYIVHFLGAIERNSIESVVRACWGDCSDSSLDGLLTPTFGQRSAWWVHKMYADMTGTIITTTPSNTNGQGLEAVGTKDLGNSRAFLLLGQHGTVSGGISVRFNNMASVPFLGSLIKIRLEGLVNSETNTSTGPVLISESNYSVVNNILDVSILNTTYAAYLLTLTFASLPGTEIPVAPTDLRID